MGVTASLAATDAQWRWTRRHRIFEEKQQIRALLNADWCHCQIPWASPISRRHKDPWCVEGANDAMWLKKWSSCLLQMRTRRTPHSLVRRDTNIQCVERQEEGYRGQMRHGYSWVRCLLCKRPRWTQCQGIKFSLTQMVRLVVWFRRTREWLSLILD